MCLTKNVALQCSLSAGKLKFKFHLTSILCDYCDYIVISHSAACKLYVGYKNGLYTLVNG